jgi:hypothetical protein
MEDWVAALHPSQPTLPRTAPARLYRLTWPCEYSRDLALVVAFDLVHQAHCLNNAYGLTYRHIVADFDEWALS